MDREVAHLRDELVPRYAEMVYNGFWFSPEREALQQFMDEIQKPVNGEARITLYKGNVIVDGRRSDSHSLYDEATVTFEADDVYDQSEAEGFINLFGLHGTGADAKPNAKNRQQRKVPSHDLPFLITRCLSRNHLDLQNQTQKVDCEQTVYDPPVL